MQYGSVNYVHVQEDPPCPLKKEGFRAKRTSGGWGDQVLSEPYWVNTSAPSLASSYLIKIF
jgi:hypothetical protein